MPGGKGEVAAGASAPVAAVPIPDVVGRVVRREIAPEEEIVELEARIADCQARIAYLRRPSAEFPKYVYGVIFQTRAEQDAAGPDFADEAP